MTKRNATPEEIEIVQELQASARIAIGESDLALNKLRQACGVPFGLSLDMATGEWLSQMDILERQGAQGKKIA